MKDRITIALGVIVVVVVAVLLAALSSASTNACSKIFLEFDRQQGDTSIYPAQVGKLEHVTIYLCPDGSLRGTIEAYETLRQYKR